VARRPGVGTLVVAHKYPHGLDRLMGLAETLREHGRVTNEVRTAVTGQALGHAEVTLEAVSIGQPHTVASSVRGPTRRPTERMPPVPCFPCLR
jgi:hypothetical protein